MPAKAGCVVPCTPGLSFLPPNRPSKAVRAPRRERAFTIVEVMMAAVILVVGFIGMISAITVGSEMLATARRQTLAAQILNHEMEKLRLTTWANMPSVGTSTVTIDSQFNSSITSAGLASGTTITLSRTVTTVTTDLSEVTLTVTWNKSGTTTAATAPTGSWLSQLAFFTSSPISRTYTRTGTAYFGKYGLNNSAQRL